MKKLFGTDGIRGVAAQPPLDPPTIHGVGLPAAGATVESAGVITPPAVAFLARAHSFAAGIVISASHNPWQDNGIKLFGPDGYKLPDSTELAIESDIFRHLESAPLSSRTLSGEKGEGPASVLVPPPVNEA